MKRSALLPLTALLLALVSCSPKAPAPSSSTAPVPTPSAPPTPSPTPTYTYVAPVLSEQVFTQDYTADDGTTVLSVSYTLPDFENKSESPALAAISAWYAAEGQALLDNTTATTAQDALSDYELSGPLGLPFQPMKEEMTYTSLYQNEQVISFAREFYASSEGTAHPTVFRMGELFDLTTGASLTFTQCFTDAIAASEQALEYILASDMAAGLMQQGVEKAQLQAAFQPENFYLTKDGFVFWFQSGDLGANNSPVEIPVPYSALKEYLVSWIG